jgi:hypothetical protein
VLPPHPVEVLGEQSPESVRKHRDPVARSLRPANPDFPPPPRSDSLAQAAVSPCPHVESHRSPGWLRQSARVRLAPGQIDSSGALLYHRA